VGESGFRIDLAVLHPEPHRGYVLGIECDGATYHSARSARARDVWREQILHDRGWRLYRIWSTRWWYDHAGEQAKLVHAIQDAVGHGHRPRRPSV
jgi:very-short-patch-repair endonuclease